MPLVLADQFRDGSVPASQGIRELVDEAYASLPTRVDGWQVPVRSDSAAYEQAVLDYWDQRGWTFAVSADRSHELHQAILALEPDAWQFGVQEAGGAVREWAEVPFVPSRASEKKTTQPYRYLAMRVRTAQGVLFADGSTVKHCTVVTNDWDRTGYALLDWQRGKAGTIEHVNRLLKDELAAGVYPSAKFGANAAWLRLQVLTANLLELLKAVALEQELRHARPKRLRFVVFTQFGRVVQHAREQFLRVVTRTLSGLLWPGFGLRRLALACWPGP